MASPSPSTNFYEKRYFQTRHSNIHAVDGNFHTCLQSTGYENDGMPHLCTQTPSANFPAHCATIPIHRSTSMSSYDIKLEKIQGEHEVLVPCLSHGSLGFKYALPLVLHGHAPPPVCINKVTRKLVQKYQRRCKTSSNFSSSPTSFDLNNGVAQAALKERINNVVDTIDIWQQKLFPTPSTEPPLLILVKKILLLSHWKNVCRRYHLHRRGSCQVNYL